MAKLNVNGPRREHKAELHAIGSVELLALEFYLAQRSAGMPIETPGVRP